MLRVPPTAWILGHCTVNDCILQVTLAEDILHFTSVTIPVVSFEGGDVTLLTKHSV